MRWLQFAGRSFGNAPAAGFFRRMSYSMKSSLLAFLMMERMYGWGKAFSGAWRYYTRADAAYLRSDES